MMGGGGHAPFVNPLLPRSDGPVTMEHLTYTITKRTITNYY